MGDVVPFAGVHTPGRRRASSRVVNRQLPLQARYEIEALLDDIHFDKPATQMRIRALTARALLAVFLRRLDTEQYPHG